LNVHYFLIQAGFERSEIIKECEENKEKVRYAITSTQLMTNTSCIHCGCLIHTNIVMSLLEPLPKNSLWSKECLGWKYINNRVAKEESHLLNSWRD
jgi:hypothetical protein